MLLISNHIELLMPNNHHQWGCNCYIAGVVIHYCYLRGLTPFEIFQEMNVTYNGAAPAMTTIYKWYDRFAKRRKTLDDEPRSGKPVNIENGP